MQKVLDATFYLATSDSSKIPNDLAPILNRLGIDCGMLCELVRVLMRPRLRDLP